MWQRYLQPSTLDEALALLDEHGPHARIVAGGTDVVVELQRGVRPTTTLIDVTALHELHYVRAEDGHIRLGALATHNDVIASPECAAGAAPLAQACWHIGAPQIRTRATVVGNLVTASPANDTIPPLIALDAELMLHSPQGERVVRLGDFYLGVRRTALQPGEIVREIRFPALRADQRGLFVKLGLRRAQAISVVSIALVLRFDRDRVAEARIALGCVAPTIVQAAGAEAFLVGKQLTPDVCEEAGRLAAQEIRPIDDLRGSAAYRLHTVSTLMADALQRIARNEQADFVHERPVLLETGALPMTTGGFRDVIATTINGRRYELPDAARKTLLDALREDAGLTGAKEGCAEGECGACTVWLNGQAVMACLVPAPQAHGGVLHTIEGLAGAAENTPVGDSLHPLQQAFIECGAVQCGFCIPGMLMAGAKLLDEHPRPNLEQAQVALSGNICRCTGYRKIFDAVLSAQRPTTNDQRPTEMHSHLGVFGDAHAHLDR